MIFIASGYMNIYLCLQLIPTKPCFKILCKFAQPLIKRQGTFFIQKEKFPSFFTKEESRTTTNARLQK